MSVVSIIQLLKRAQGYQKQYPGLSVECAIGLTGLDLGPAEYYAPLFEGCDLFAGCPGGEISEEVYEDVRGRYVRMQENLVAVRGFGLNPRDPEALSTKTIDGLRPLIAE